MVVGATRGLGGPFDFRLRLRLRRDKLLRVTGGELRGLAHGDRWGEGRDGSLRVTVGRQS